MKAFLLNLDKDVDRLAAADAQLRRLGIPYERISAVYGKMLSSAEVRRHVSRLRSLMTHGMMWTPGQYGCTLSHLFLYKHMMDENLPMALIFEDDVQFSDDFPKALAAVEKFVDASRRQVILLSDHSDNVNQRLVAHADEVKVISILGDLCSEAYVITLPAARELYRVNYPMAVMVDAWTRYRKRGHIDLYRTEPPLTKQNRDDFASTIEMRTIGRGGPMKFLWKAWRAVGCVADVFYHSVSGR